LYVITNTLKYFLLLPDIKPIKSYGLASDIEFFLTTGVAGKP